MTPDGAERVPRPRPGERIQPGTKTQDLRRSPTRRQVPRTHGPRESSREGRQGWHGARWAPGPEVPMKIKDLMAPVGLLVANEDDNLALSAQMMLWGRVRHLPVVRKGEVVGVLSERDILVRRGEMAKERWEHVRVREVMSQPAVVV